MSQKFQRWTEFAIHLIFWVGLYLLVSRNGESKMVIEEMGAPDRVIDSGSLQLLAYLASALIFYGNVLVLHPGLFRKKKHKVYVLLLGLWVAFVCFLEWSYLKSLLPLPSDKAIQSALVNHAVFLLFSIIYILIKQQLIISREALLKREDQLKNELTFLKSQLNPHFLFNSINNIFSIAQKNGDNEAAQHIADLSKVMRYALYESDDQRVPLRKELNFIQSYVEMSQLRFSEEDLQLVFKIEGNVNDQKLAPLLLVPLVENAFKYTPVSGPENHITIKMVVDSQRLKTQISNSLPRQHTVKDTHVGGIGLTNLRRRLELLYPGSYTLTVDRTESTFHVTLEVPLDE